jgi:hypothetical protein
VSRGSTADIDPKFWSIEDGKLYLNLNQDVNEKWMDNLSENIEKAHENWPAVLE